MIFELTKLEIGIIMSVISTFLTFLFTRRKYNIDIHRKEIESLRDIVEIYRNTVDDLKVEVEHLRNIITRQNEELKEPLEIV